MTKQEWQQLNQRADELRRQDAEQVYQDFLQACQKKEDELFRETLKQELKQELAYEMELMIQRMVNSRISQELPRALNNTTFKLK